MKYIIIYIICFFFNTHVFSPGSGKPFIFIYFLLIKKMIKKKPHVFPPGSGKPFPRPLAVKKELEPQPDTTQPHKVLIVSEEQFKVGCGDWIILFSFLWGTAVFPLKP